MTPTETIIIGGGLAGCEAAWQLLRYGHPVTLFEMRPLSFSPAHKTDHLAELVCSNSLRSNIPENAVGLLKEEMRKLDSLIMEAADATSVPAGRALAVDRNLFSSYIEAKLTSQRGFSLIRKECVDIPDSRPLIIASGPLTSPGLSRQIAALTGDQYLYFYDAISPIVEGSSIDYKKVFFASRYDEEGEGDYLNCPFEKDEFENFWQALTSAEEVPLKDFESAKYFEGCLPIEVIAKRGINTLTFGPMKPVGLKNPLTGKQPFAVVQLRRENMEGAMYNMVGFQTKLIWPEQQRIFRMIPGLEEAEFTRLGSIHRNTFINAPALLDQTLQLRAHKDIFLAGQITGVEGYVESAAMGLLAGLNVHYRLHDNSFAVPPVETALGSLIHYITTAEVKTFQPMNVNFGLFPPLAGRYHKKDRGFQYALRARKVLDCWKDSCRL